MCRLELDYGKRSDAGRSIGMAMLAVAVLATMKLVDVYAESRRETERIEAHIAQLERRMSGRTDTAPGLQEATIREIRYANAVIDQIALPWERLFRAVESAANARVALLGITPDQKNGTVEVSGEAADLNTMFDYVKRLERQPTLSRVYLLNHQVNAQDPQRPVRFTVTASWMEKPSSL
jgi:Tfp pilus assembly protein PilN